MHLAQQLGNWTIRKHSKTSRKRICGGVTMTKIDDEIDCLAHEELSQKCYAAVTPSTEMAAAQDKQVKPGSNIFGGEFANVHDFFEIGRELGRGKYGIVRLCEDRVTGELFACKSLKKSLCVTRKDQDGLRNEVVAMELLKCHPDTVNIHAILEDQEECHILMELCDGGDLFDRIRERRQYPEADAAAVVLSLVSVVAACQRMGLIHRDLKPENVLLQHRDCHTSITVVDFGLAEFVKPGERVRSRVGTPYYAAPEVLVGVTGPESDMWSVGVILYCMLSGQPPFWHETDEGILDAIEEGCYDLDRGPWRRISDEAKDLISRFLIQNPRKRVTPLQVARHPWIRIHCQAQLQNDLFQASWPGLDIPCLARWQGDLEGCSESDRSRSFSSECGRSRTYSIERQY